MKQTVKMALILAKYCASKLYKSTIRKVKEAILWDYYYASLREPKVKFSQPFKKNDNEIMAKLKNSGFNVVDFKIDVEDYWQYLHKAKYQKFPLYCMGGRAKNFAEKSLEHYLAAKLLNLSKEDIYIDIANSFSPAPEIYRRLYGCKVYWQDLIFPRGVNGNIIGGDASNLPLEGGFATKMALHCSFEHFEQDSDIKFIKEASRVLRKGGKLCILPLYLSSRYTILTDPVALPIDDLQFESDATLLCYKGWGNRHGRIYDVPHLTTRIKNNLQGLKLTIYVIRSEKEIDPSCYIKFAALFEKE